MSVICDICGIRPAVARLSINQGGKVRTFDLCAEDYAKVQHDPQLQNTLMNQPVMAGIPNTGAMPPAVDISTFFSPATHTVLQTAAETAQKAQHSLVEPEHIVIALMADDMVKRVLEQFKIKPEDVIGYIESNTEQGSQSVTSVSPSQNAQRVVLAAHTISMSMGHVTIEPAHILVAILEADQGVSGNLFRMYGLTPESLRQQVVKVLGSPTQADQESLLEKYARNLTTLAKDNQLDPVIGRTEEIETVIEVLARRTKNNPVLIGEPGVGKTAIAEGLAQRIISEEVPSVLKGKQVMEISLNSLVAGTRYRGEFEERIQNLLNEVREKKDELILFIDELHTVIGAGGGEGGLDAANVIKPALARGELRLIGATTLAEYRKYIEKDAAFERRFQPVMVAEPSPTDSIQIIQGLRSRYEEHHKVAISNAAIQAAVDLSHRYITQRFLPDKAIDVIDQAAARVRIAHEKKKGTPQVEVENIAEVVAKITGVPVTQLTEEERQKLLNLEARLHQRVIGQHDAVRAVSNAIRLSRAGLHQKHHPVATFLFVGPTGVGKTELAKALAAELYGGEEAMIRIDMSEYMERHSVARLIGSPPGYVGHEEGGQLTEAVRRRPHTVILLDEIEKAHPDIYNALLQVFDDGRLTDGKGRVVDFSNTLIIATSNLGSSEFDQSKPIGFGAQKQQDIAIDSAITTHFRPEFLNRIDEIVHFHPLSKDNLTQIVELKLATVANLAASQKITVTFTKPLVKHLVEVGYSPKFGARELHRTVKTLVENPLAHRMLEGVIKKSVTVGYTPKQGVIFTLK